VWAIFDTKARRIVWLMSRLERAVEIAARMNLATEHDRFVPKACVR
jgi:hypothetical protein